MSLMNRKISNATSLILGIGLFSFLIYKIGIDKVLATFSRFSVFSLVIILAFGILIAIPPTLVWNKILHLNGIYIKKRDLINISFAGEAISYVTPSAYFGGEPVKAWFLKKLYGTEMDCSLSAILIEKFLRISSYFLSAMIGILFIFTQYYLPPTIEISLAVAVSLCVLVYLFLFTTIFTGKGIARILIKKTYLHKFKLIQRNYHKITNFDCIFSQYFEKNRKQAINQFFLSLITVAVVILRYYIILSAFGYSPSFFQVFIIFSAGAFATVIPFVPGSLGIYEVVMILMTTIFFGNPSLGIALAFMVRFSDLAKVVYGLAVFMIYKLRISHKKTLIHSI